MELLRMRRPRVACGSCLKTEHSECSVTQLNSRGKKEKKKACRHTHTETQTQTSTRRLSGLLLMGTSRTRLQMAALMGEGVRGSGVEVGAVLCWGSCLKMRSGRSFFITPRKERADGRSRPDDGALYCTHTARRQDRQDRPWSAPSGFRDYYYCWCC